ncbi:MAG: VanZ family protein [Bacteroidaceae bacterium]|nr:VanZ family protein [Bacteroidaceae bacterium]
MPFQYFFFDTYIGYFLQALPIALVVGAIYGVVRFRADKDTPISRKLFSCAFVCYITGLVCLVVGLDLMNIVWYKLLYCMDPGKTIDWFGGEFDFALDFINNISGETIGNFLMFLPFGFLYPLSQQKPTWKKSSITGLLVVIVIELFQPIFGRAFDMNDIVLNILGIVISASIFMVVKKAIKQ